MNEPRIGERVVVSGGDWEELGEITNHSDRHLWIKRKTENGKRKEAENEECNDADSYDVDRGL
jgi:hypothetical protein